MSDEELQASSFSTTVAVAEPTQSDLDEQLKRTSLLLQLSIEFRETLEPTVIIERMLHVMVGNLGIPNASVVLIDWDGTVDLAMSLRQGNIRHVTSMVTRAVLDRGLAGWALRNGRSVVLPDVSRDKRWIPYADWQRVGSAIVLPIRQAQTTLGVLTVYHPIPNHFTSRDMLLMEGVAAQAGVAIGSSRRYIEESRRREQVLALFAMSQFLTSEHSYEDLARVLQEKSTGIFEVDYGILFLLKSGTTNIPVPVMIPELNAPEQKLLLRSVSTMVRKSWEQKSIITDSDPPENPLCTMMVIPLIHSGTILGAVVLVRLSSEQVNYPANMWSMLTTFTNVIAATCANMKLVADMRQHTSSLETMITERTHMVQKSRNTLRVVFDNLPEGLLLLDTQETIMAANNAFCYPIIGRHPRLVVGQEYSSVWEEIEQRGDMRIEMGTASQSGGTNRGNDPMHIFCATSIRQKRWFEVIRTPILDDAGDKEYYIERWTDITRQKSLEKHLLLQDQRNILGHLTSRIVYDIGTPLAQVLHHLSTTLQHSAIPTDVRNTLTQASADLQYIEQTLHSISSLYKTPTNSWVCININELLQQLQQFTASQFEHVGVSVVLDLDPAVRPVYGQPVALRQVLLGLLFNAQEAMPNGGTITVTTRWDKGEQGVLSPLCRITVRDTGHGMHKERLTSLFEPFTSDKQQGVGMGLYLSKQIIEQHTGRLEIDSEEGKGTVVDILLPWDERCHQFE